jgi:hypothetical protein
VLGLLAVLLAVTIGVIWTGDPPPMYDASSHVATATIARELRAGDPFFTEHWSLAPTPVPYWFTTLALEPLLGFLAPTVALRVLLTLYALALPLAFLALARTVPDGDERLALLAALAIFNWAYWLGETNFLFGQPIAIFAIAALRRARRVASGWFLAFAVLAIVAYSCHVFVLSALLGAVGLGAILTLAGRRFPALADRPPLGPGLAAVAWTGLLFAVAVRFVFFGEAAGSNVGRLVFDLSPHRLGNVFADPLASPARTSPLVAAALLLALGVLWLLPRAGHLRRRGLATLRDAVHLPTAIVGAAFALLVWLGPVALEEPGGIREEDISPRFTMISFLFLAASVRLPRRPLVTVGLGAAVVAFGALSLSDARTLHREQTEIFATLRSEIFAKIPPESRVLPVLESRERDPRRTTYFRLYAANWLVAERRCWVASVFAQRGQQPLRHRAIGDHRSIYVPEIRANEWELADWVLVQSAREAPRIAGLAERAELVAAAEGFFLYRVREVGG